MNILEECRRRREAAKVAESAAPKAYSHLHEGASGRIEENSSQVVAAVGISALPDVIYHPADSAATPKDLPPLAATSSATPAARKVPRVPGVTDPTTAKPCPTCGCPLAWESIYRDGVKKCEQCHPAPSRRIVGERWAIVTAGVEVLPGGEIRGDPAPSHSWQPLRDCWRHAAAERDSVIDFTTLAAVPV